jgi:hypothetical protein
VVEREEKNINSRAVCGKGEGFFGAWERTRLRQSTHSEKGREEGIVSLSKSSINVYLLGVVCARVCVWVKGK